MTAFWIFHEYYTSWQLLSFHACVCRAALCSEWYVKLYLRSRATTSRFNRKSRAARRASERGQTPLSGQDTVSTDSRNDFLEVRKAVQFVLIVGVKTDFYVFLLLRVFYTFNVFLFFPTVLSGLSGLQSLSPIKTDSRCVVI